MNRIIKGNFGYIAYKRKTELIIAIIMYAISAAVFGVGYITTGSQKNLLTIVAVLGVLPASKRLVSVIMFFRAGMCSVSLKKKIESKEGLIRMLYDVYLTSEKENYQLSNVVIRNKTVVAVTETENTSCKAGEAHIIDRLAADGIKNISVKIFSSKEIDKYLNRVEALVEAEDETEGLNDRIADVLVNISL